MRVLTRHHLLGLMFIPTHGECWTPLPKSSDESPPISPLKVGSESLSVIYEVVAALDKNVRHVAAGIG